MIFQTLFPNLLQFNFNFQFLASCLVAEHKGDALLYSVRIAVAHNPQVKRGGPFGIIIKRVENPSPEWEKSRKSFWLEVDESSRIDFSQD